MPRLSAGSTQTLLMQQHGSARDSFASGNSSGGMIGANTTIVTPEKMMHIKEPFSSNYHRGSSNDSTRSIRSSELPQPPVTRKPPKKTSSLHAGLVPQTTLPRIVSDSFATDRSNDPTPRRATRRNRFRAAENGKGDVLPSYSTASSNANRSRTNSLSNLIQSPFRTHAEPLTRSVRNRKRSVHSDDEGSCVIGSGGGERTYVSNHRRSWNDPDDFSHNKGDHHRPKHRSFSSLLPGESRWMNMKSSHCMVLFLLFCVACFTAGSYRKVFDATAKLELVQHEESLLLLHLHKVEEHLIDLHDNVRRLTDRNDGPLAVNPGTQRLSVDSDLLDVQMRKLREMEAELDHEVRSLQNRLSDSAKRSIVNSFGEGAVQVDLDISFGNNDSALASNTISIRLWYDTPHTAWTFLQQVQNGSWNGAKFSVYHGRALLVQTESGGEVEPQVDFIEQSQRGHDRYTVGLTDTGIILNIQDNRDYFKKEASVGVITSGFDTLRQLVTEVEGAQSDSAIIRRASVSHLRKEQK